MNHYAAHLTARWRFSCIALNRNVPCVPTGPVEVPPSGPVAAFAFATTPGTELRPSFVAIGLMRTLLLLGLATQGLSLQLPARPRLRKPLARPASEAYQLLSYRAFGLFVPLWIAFSTENAEALTATPSPGADELQISSAQWRAREKDRAEAAKAKMYEERSAADATRAREREARRAAVEARRLEAGREASGAAAARMLEKATVVQARAAAMEEAAAAAQERATAAKARAIAARSMSAEELVSASAAEKVMSTDELAAAAALQAEQAAVDAEVSTLICALLPCNPAIEGGNFGLQPHVSGGGLGRAREGGGGAIARGAGGAGGALRRGGSRDAAARARCDRARRAADCGPGMRQVASCWRRRAPPRLLGLRGLGLRGLGLRGLV